MAFRLGDRLYKEILYFYTEDLISGDPLYILTQLSESTIEITAESTEYNDKNGNLVKKDWKSKAGSFNATNAFVNMNIAAAASGSTPIFASEDNVVEMPKMLYAKKGTEVKIPNYVEGSVKVSRYYGDGAIDPNVKYTKGEGDTATATTYVISGEGEDAVLKLPTDAEPDMYFIKYLRTAKSGAKISNRADKFPTSVKAIMKATYFNPCRKNELRADYIEFPSFQVSPEVSLPVNSDSATMDFSGDLEIDYCGGEKVLFNIYDADEVDAE